MNAYFKKVNDVYGHQFGDSVLTTIANIVKQRVRKVDVVARYGGEEFVVILPETGGNGAYTAAENLRKIIESHVFEATDGTKFRVTASFGVSTLYLLPEEIIDKSRQIIKSADMGLYAAKDSGRNTVKLLAST